MSKFFPQRTSRLARGSIASPLYLLEWAALLTVLFVIVQLAGLRDFTSVLNGTVGSTHLSWQTASFLGAAYIFVYLGFVLVVPILLLAAGILKIWQRIVATQEVPDEPRANTEKN
ncbi:MAG TPA: hypothetical protein VKV04_05950 [Verrucomicrobiae bacterium]|nr:hypothetical protein [Verrucomicrobiae bacterium]